MMDATLLPYIKSRSKMMECSEDSPNPEGV